MFANTQMAGQDMAPAEVMKEPPPAPPVVAPNLAMGMMGVGGVLKVLVCGTPVHNLLTKIPMTLGPVGLGGAASGSVMGPSQHLTGANSVLMGNAPVTRMTSQTLQNLTNAPGVRLGPSQTHVLIQAK